MQILQYQLTQLKNSRKIRIHLLLQLLNLQLRHLILRVIEYFLTEHFEDIKVVLADVHIFGGGLADVVDKGGPGVVPLIFYYLHEDGVTLRQDVVHRF